MANSKDIGKYFIRTDVQDILKSLTGFDLQKIFSPKFNTNMKKSKIELLTDEQLEKYNRRSKFEAIEMLQMPPVLPSREPCDKVLVDDSKLNLLFPENIKKICIDISLNVPREKRLIVVRESNGRLRHASWKERENMIHKFYPVEGRDIIMPKMFEPEHLENSLKEKMYMVLLNKACIQFEPNDPEFIRVTNRVYEYINEMNDYEVLWSTRFYGPMVFYLVWYKSPNNLVAYYLNKTQINKCFQVVSLYYIIHDNAKTRKEFMEAMSKKPTNKFELIKMFVLNELIDNAKVELALHNCQKELENKPKNEQQQEDENNN